MRAMGKKERSNNEGLWRYDAPGAKVLGQAPTRSKTGPRREASQARRATVATEGKLRLQFSQVFLKLAAEGGFAPTRNKK